MHIQLPKHNANVTGKEKQPTRVTQKKLFSMSTVILHYQYKSDLWRASFNATIDEVLAYITPAVMYWLLNQFD